MLNDKYWQHQIEEWQRGADHFTAQLLSLIAKADRSNRELIRKGFPEAVEAYEAWVSGGNY